MTNRRSLKTPAARDSRQTQFNMRALRHARRAMTNAQQTIDEEAPA